MKHNESIRTAPKKKSVKVSVLDCLSTIALMSIIFMSATPTAFSNDGDPREEIVVVAGVIGGGISLTAAVAAATTAPAWAPAVAAVGAGVLFVGVCILVWDHFDGDDTGRYDSEDDSLRKGMLCIQPASPNASRNTKK